MLPVVVLVATVQAPAPPESLADLADQLAWDPAARGPLLLIGAELTRPDGYMAPARRDPPETAEEAALRAAYPRVFPPFPEPGARGYSLDAIAPRFRRRVVRIGQVTTLARLLRRNPAPLPTDSDDQESETSQRQRLVALLGSLTSGQWALAGGDGLGREHLTLSQAAAWDAMLPEELGFTFPFGRAPSAGRPPTAEDRARLRARLPVDPEALRGMDSVPLSPEQRASLRLRLSRRMAVKAFFSDSPDALDIDISEPESEGEGESQTMRFKGWTFEELIQRRLQPVPALAKPSAIDFQAVGLDPLVPLAGAATVGELVGRIARRTGVPVSADARWASVSVRTRGESARAGDLLQALARGIDGAVRRLGEGDQALYLLTDDMVPGALREAPENERLAVEMGSALATGLLLARDAAAGSRLLGASRDLFRLPRLGAVDLPEAFWSEPGHTARIADLPAAYRVRLRDAWAETDDETHSTKLPPDRVRASHLLNVTLALPELAGIATIARIDLTDAFQAAATPESVAPVAWPEKFVQRAAGLALPVSVEERTKLLDVAVRARLTQLFVPADRADAAMVAPLAAAAKERGIGVVPVLTPLAGAANPPDAPRDVSTAGKTARQWAQGPSARAIARNNRALLSWISWLGESDFVVPEAVDPATVARRIETLAKLPGVAFVALRDLDFRRSGADDNVRPFLWSGGATMGVRRRFILEHGADPADRNASPDTIFRDANATAERDRAWFADRDARFANLLARIDAAVRPSTLPVPLILQVRAFDRDGSHPHWEPWTGKPAKEMSEDDALPTLYLCALDPVDFDLGYLSPDRLDAGSLLRPAAEQFRAWVGTKLTERPWTGGVLDLTRRPLAEGLRILETTLARSGEQ